MVGTRVYPAIASGNWDFLQQFDLPLIACIRQAQRYVHAVETGVTLFDGGTVDPVDQIQWKPLLDWLVRRR